MSNEVLDRYFELRRQQFAIEAELESLKESVIARLKQQGNVARSDLGELRLRTYISWQYSQDVLKQQSDLNVAKRIERDSGKAQILEKRPSLVLMRKQSQFSHTAEAVGEYGDDDGTFTDEVF